MIKNIMMCIGYPFISIDLGTYMIFLIIMFSAVFSLTRFPPTFQFLLFLEKNIYFSIMVGIMEFLESLSCSDL